MPTEQFIELAAELGNGASFPGSDRGSIGIVRSVDLDAADGAQMLAASDRALYSAKRAGRGRAVLLAPGD